MKIANVNLKNKNEKRALLIGMLVAFVVSAFVPAEYNPAVIINDLVEKFKSK